MNLLPSILRSDLVLVGTVLAVGTATACGSSDSSRRASGDGGDGAGGATASSGGRATGSGGSGTGGRATGSGGRSASGGATGSGGAGTGGRATGSGGADAGIDARDATPPDADSGPLDASLTDTGIGDTFVPITVLVVDFEGTIPANVDIGGGTLTPSQGFAPLGPPGNTFGPTFLRGPTGNTVTITFSNLPPHTSLSVDFLFGAIDSLDGTGSFPAGDFVRIDLDGQQIFRESFANATPSQIQSYVPPPGVELARHVDLGFSGPGSYYTDSAYDLGADPIFDDIPHTASSAALVFTLEGAGVQDINDESWAIDNLRVTTGNTPRARDGSP